MNGLQIEAINARKNLCRRIHALSEENLQSLVHYLNELESGLVPNAKVGHIGLYRDPETHKPVEYYCKLPTDIEKRQVFVVDPMLATGGSAVEAIRLLKGYGAKDITFMCLIASPEGIGTLQAEHPDIDIFIAAKDEKLNENAYIVPGLGDAGDRLYGTK